MFEEKICNAIIVAGGNGKRMNTDIPKQFLILGDKPVLVHTLEVFEKCALIDTVTVVCIKNYIEHCRGLLEKFNLRKVKKIIEGGAQRQNSVYNAIKDDNSDYICVHDAVRPLVNLQLIEKTIAECKNNDGCICAAPAKDTIKICDEYVKMTLPREKIFLVQTPQSFKTQILKKVYEQAFNENFTGTDDSSLMEHYGYKIKVIESDYANLKITEPCDLTFAKIYLGIEK